MKHKWILNLLAVFVVAAGSLVLFYPIVSNWLYQRSQQERADYYENLAEELPQEQADELWAACSAYNEALRKQAVQLDDPFADVQSAQGDQYDTLLNLDGDGAMGSVEIPAIGCRLVVYHGTSADVLAKGIGHLRGTSLPVGGTGTHAVLTGHTGTSDKKLFTDLDQLETGDVFYLHILGETLAYEIDQILVVLPGKTDSLYIDSEQDYVTLVTCTPYGINSHRLLVRGHRIPYEDAKEIEESRGRTDSTWSIQYMRAVIAGLLLVLIMIIIVVLIRSVKKRRRQRPSN